MKKWLDELRGLWGNRFYVLGMSFAAVFSYGFLVTHQTVGIDDTPYAYYFEEGLAAVVGRWVLFLVNKVLRLADFGPFMIDLCGVLILMLAASVWCALLIRILGKRVPFWGYLAFSCLFLSNPLISEVYTYYLHNGVALGYLCSGIGLCCFWEGLERVFGKGLEGAAGKSQEGSVGKDLEGAAKEEKNPWKRMFRKDVLALWCGSLAGLWIAMGCYESFMVVYLVGVCIVLCSARIKREKAAAGFLPVFYGLLTAAVIAVLGVVLRSLTIEAVTGIFHLEYMKGDGVQRSITEMADWILGPDAFSNFGMIVKRVLVMYGVFAYAYYPIRIYVLAVAAVLLLGAWWSVRKRDPWIFLLALGSLIASYLLVVVEGKATYYRSAQFLPLFSAWGLLLAVYAAMGAEKKLRGRLQKVLKGVLAAVLCVILWNQCMDMNQWFYIDWLKYEEARNTADQIAYELEKNFDISKPVVFTGVYQVPRSIIQPAYVTYNSPTHLKMLRLTSLIDEHLLEKFNREYGVWVAQAPALSVIDWARRAFETDEELTRFFAMHGHELVFEEDVSVYDEAELYSQDWPGFPREGSIVDMGDYIVVHFE